MTARRSLCDRVRLPLHRLRRPDLGAAPQATTSPNVLPALLAEVHRTASGHGAIAPSRPACSSRWRGLNIQEQRTVILSSQLDRIRQEQAAAILETEKLAAALRRRPGAANQHRDPGQRRGWESEEAGSEAQAGAAGRHR